MNGIPSAVLDSSALLAYLRDEPGADQVREVLSQGAAISAVNWAEVLTKLADIGKDPHREAVEILEGGVLASTLVVMLLDERVAREIAHLRQSHKSAGLSLGDRACLALASLLGIPVVTTNPSWQSLNLEIKIRTIR